MLKQTSDQDGTKFTVRTSNHKVNASADAGVQPCQSSRPGRLIDARKDPKAAASQTKAARLPSLKEPDRIRAEPVGVWRILTPVRIVILVLLAGLVLAPNVVIVGGLCLTFITVGAFLLFSARRIWRFVAWIARAYAGSDPVRADRVYDRLDRFALRWDGLLDRFPDGMVDQLYMPDFANIEVGTADDDPVFTERLKRLR